ncbi:MAG: dimethylarginine dimethylaminohydrolase family protein [Acidimicrobiales bacterium]
MSGLSWGRRLLMCRPEHFGVAYEINPWMHAEVHPDLDLARDQFDHLVATLGAAGAQIQFQDPVEGVPDLVFTANAGIVNGHQFVPASFRHPQRRAETPHDVAWFRDRGWKVDYLPTGLRHEGAGDALPFEADPDQLRPRFASAASEVGRGAEVRGPVLVSGYRLRSDAASHGPLSGLVGAPVRSVELVDERLYHLDLVFCPLDGRRAMVAPLGLDSYGLRVIKALVPELLVLEDPEALAFVANSVVVDHNIVMPACPTRVGHQLEAWGFTVAVAPVGEFQKAGGGCRCLTLALDTTLGSPLH